MNFPRLFNRPSPPVVTPEPDTALNKHLMFRELARRYPEVRLVGEGLRLEPMSIGDLARVTWTINRANGFPDYQGDGIPVALVLIHDEICEAYSEYVIGRMSEAFFEELADVYIRALDLIESVFPGRVTEAQPGNVYGIMADMDVRESILLLHTFTSHCLRLFRRRREGQPEMPDALLKGLARLYLGVFVLVTKNGVVFDPIVLDKLEKNSHRPYRHGGKRI